MQHCGCNLYGRLRPAAWLWTYMSIFMQGGHAIKLKAPTEPLSRRDSKTDGTAAHRSQHHEWSRHDAKAPHNPHLRESSGHHVRPILLVAICLHTDATSTPPLGPTLRRNARDLAECFILDCYALELPTTGELGPFYVASCSSSSSAPSGLSSAISTGPSGAGWCVGKVRS